MGTASEDAAQDMAEDTADATGSYGLTVGLVMLYVSDMAKARAFYEGTLGLRVVRQLSSDSFVFYQLAGGSPIALQPAAAAPEGVALQPGGCELGVEVDDVDAVFRAWSAQGVALSGEIIDMGAGRMFRVRDPDGRIINVYTLYPQVRDFRRAQGL